MKLNEVNQLNEDITVILAISGTLYLLGYKSAAIIFTAIVTGSLFMKDVTEYIKHGELKKLSDIADNQDVSSTESKAILRTITDALLSGNFSKIASLFK